MNYGQSLDKGLRRIGFEPGANWSEIAQNKIEWHKIIKKKLGLGKAGRYSEEEVRFRG